MVAWFSLAASIVGMVLGTAGFVLGVLTYLRDRPRIKVSFNLNMVDPRTKRQAGMVVVTNTGRRAVFISAVAVEPPNAIDGTILLLNDSISGTRLGEGDKPLKLLVQLADLIPHKYNWREIRAFAEDSTGERYYSPEFHESSHPPKWTLSEEVSR